MSLISINTNISSIGVQRRLFQSTKTLGQSFERLSSGLRINRASDDAAGLQIAADLNVDSQVYTQGIRNASDAISLLNIAEGAMSELSNILVRQQEIATSAANGTLSLTQRQSLNEEARALTQEYNRILSSTEFNGINVLDGSFNELVVQVGYGAQEQLRLALFAGSQTVGDGTFQQPVSYGTGLRAEGVAVGDLNGDGKIDLVTADHDGDSVSILLGNGDGTFQNIVSYSSGIDPRQVIVADYNNDGILDISSADRNGIGPPGTLSIFLGNGDGTFQNRVSYTGGDFYHSASGDFNGDGVPDITTADRFDDSISVFIANGDGTFQNRVSYAAGDDSSKVTTGDFNGDGKVDIATPSVIDDVVSIFLGNGDGTFQSRVSYAVLSNSFSIAAGDFNKDGALDLATFAAGNTSILLGNGDGSFQAPVSYAVGTIGTDDSISVDFNGDGNLDLTGKSASDSVFVLFGNGDGTFGSLAIFNAGDKPENLAVADVNGDGGIDIIATNELDNTLSVLIANITQTTTSKLNPLPIFNLTSQSGARSAMSSLATELERLSQNIGDIGSHQSRVSTAIANLQQIKENYTQAASRILDVDVAVESAQLIKSQILQQAGNAILAQANSVPQLAISLLSNSSR